MLLKIIFEEHRDIKTLKITTQCRWVDPDANLRQDYHRQKSAYSNLGGGATCRNGCSTCPGTIGKMGRQLQLFQFLGYKVIIEG